MEYNPVARPLVHIAARTAPAAKTVRLPALWVNSTRSPSPANTTE